MKWTEETFVKSSMNVLLQEDWANCLRNFWTIVSPWLCFWAYLMVSDCWCPSTMTLVEVVSFSHSLLTLEAFADFHANMETSAVRHPCRSRTQTLYLKLFGHSSIHIWKIVNATVSPKSVQSSTYRSWDVGGYLQVCMFYFLLKNCTISISRVSTSAA